MIKKNRNQKQSMNEDIKGQNPYTEREITPVKGIGKSFDFRPHLKPNRSEL